eukprot:644400-Pelagomonas_calceolata.AAC.1
MLCAWRERSGWGASFLGSADADDHPSVRQVSCWAAGCVAAGASSVADKSDAEAGGPADWVAEPRAACRGDTSESSSKKLDAKKERGDPGRRAEQAGTRAGVGASGRGGCGGRMCPRRTSVG